MWVRVVETLEVLEMSVGQVEALKVRLFQQLMSGGLLDGATIQLVPFMLSETGVYFARFLYPSSHGALDLVLDGAREK